MNGLALCSGIGGLDLGLHIALDGYRTVCHVEREAFCASALVARMEDEALDSAPVWDDITTFDGNPWRGIVDIISAGYPCQPFSVAGRRAGVADPRHLWPHVARIIGECEPGLVFLENVPGHLNIGFDEVAEDLDGMDYEVAATLLTAAELGATHRRERLFVLAHPDGEGRREAERGDAEGARPVQRGGDVGNAEVGDVGTGLRAGGPGGLGRGRPDHTDGDVENAIIPGAGGEGGSPGGRAGGAYDKETGRNALYMRDKARGGDVADTLGPGLEERRPGPVARSYPAPWPPGPSDIDGWREALDIDPTLEPAVRRVADGPTSRVDRLRALGNSVVPVQAAVAFVSLARELELI
jgi:DNA (cytosine-5)-methyltransferase 1